jgi:tryptophan synthase alpha chain
MNRIDLLFRSNKNGLLSIYFTAGYPLLDSLTSIVKNLAETGVDLIEIGVPFSDPLADGPVIQKSNDVALKNGMNVNLLFDQLENIRHSVDIPLILMGYFNPVLRFGVEAFCRKCYDTGIDGVILPDLPPEQFSIHYSGTFRKYGIKNILLISPQTDDTRVRMIDELSDGFLYMVSSASTTGIKHDFSGVQLEYFRRIKALNLSKPRLIGFGISDSATFREACKHADGAIIGSAFIKLLGEKGTEKETITSFIKSIRS